MDLQLKDKIIIVSGGAKGIGEGISRVLAKEGAIPVIIGRSEADNTATVNAIIAEGGKLPMWWPSLPSQRPVSIR